MVTCIAYELTRYIPLFDELEQEQVLGKIIRLYTPGDRDADKPSLSLPRLQLDDLFVTEQVPRTSHSDSPHVVGLNGSVDAQSPRNIDPNLVGNGTSQCSAILTCTSLLLIALT